MKALYHQSCHANRVWWLRWPMPHRLLVWLDHNQNRLMYRRLSRLIVVSEDNLFRTYRCDGCQLQLHEDL